MKILFLLLALVGCTASYAQPDKLTLSVEKIMRDPRWMGSSPANPSWSDDGRLFFYWNPENAISDSLYFLDPATAIITKADAATRQMMVPNNAIRYNTARTAYTYSKDGDIFYVVLPSRTRKRITQTTAVESGSRFGLNDTKIIYQRDLNLYSWDIVSGETVQLSVFKSGDAPNENKKSGKTAQEKWLKQDQLAIFEVLRNRKYKKDLADSLQKKSAIKPLRTIYTGEKELNETELSQDGQYLAYTLSTEGSNARNTIVPTYVTLSGFTEEIPGRTKVGEPVGSSELFLFDRFKDTVYTISTEDLPGIRNQPEYQEKIGDPPVRTVNFTNIIWAPAAAYALVDIRSVDNKDRWLMLLSGATARLTLIDHQHDSAWIGGPGIGGSYGGGNMGWINDNECWFQSEKTGYSHLYLHNLQEKSTHAISSGNFEIQSARLSRDKKYFYVSTNEVHPGEQHFYRLKISNGNREKLTMMTGSNQVSLSPDEKKLAILYSASNKPWELFLQDNKQGASARQMTNLASSAEFSTYPWREPELITFSARDGATVYARLYQPANPHPSKPAVIFVHGAGYLQNAHKWWSSYFREYMFHNLLADKGYTVLDIDYRASAGYGRNWRTGIYRFMGGKDLTDNIDGAKLLVDKYGINPKNIGIYGGSYGGFITLMAMFTAPGTFASGAALRPVTDWAHYNHGYTSNILNEPFTDSLAYRRSSPIYYAAGLTGNLLICHGLVDTNVHFEDVVRLSQRLIELGKDNWELTAYPLEDHGFVEPSSWTDEYKRIFKLFERTLKQ